MPFEHRGSAVAPSAPVAPPELSVSQPVQGVVIGSHMGSNMEPLSLLEECFKQASVDFKSTVLGTTYPPLN